MHQSEDKYKWLTSTQVNVFGYVSSSAVITSCVHLLSVS